MNTQITLTLPAKLKVQVARAAKLKGRSTQRWMLEVIEREIERKRRFLDYVVHTQPVFADTEALTMAESRRRLGKWLKDLAAEAPASRRVR